MKRNLSEQVDKEKRGWDGKQEKQFLTAAMTWKRGELDRGGKCCHL